MKEFYDLLAKEGLTAKKFIKKIISLSDSKIIDLIMKIRQKVAEVQPQTEVNEDCCFVVNAKLSGDVYPCSHIEHRLEYADQLARFAALYADKVLIRNPLGHYFFDFSDELTSTEDIHYIKKRLIDDLRVLYHFKPLVDGGIADFVIGHFGFCKNHLEELLVEPKVMKNFSRAKQALNNKFIKKVEATLYKVLNEDDKVSNEDYLLTLEGPPDLVEHGSVVLPIYELPEHLTKPLIDKDIYKLTIKEIKQSNYVDILTEHVTRDVLIQNLHVSASSGYKYLTDRKIDFDILRAINNIEVNKVSEALLNGFKHSVPFINDVSLDKLVKLRQVEGESFAVYRDTLSGTLKNLDIKDLTNQKRIKEILDDCINPEIRKIDLAVKSSRTLLYGSLKQDLIFSAGFIAVGIFSGFISPVFGQLVTTLGGYKFVSGLLEKANKLATGHDDILRDNKFYFLWKVREQAKKQNKLKSSKKIKLIP